MRHKSDWQSSSVYRVVAVLLPHTLVMMFPSRAAQCVSRGQIAPVCASREDATLTPYRFALAAAALLICDVSTCVVRFAQIPLSHSLARAYILLYHNMYTHDKQ